jgi:hypothetical protein
MVSTGSTSEASAPTVSMISMISTSEASAPTVSDGPDGLGLRHSSRRAA